MTTTMAMVSMPMTGSSPTASRVHGLRANDGPAGVLVGHHSGPRYCNVAPVGGEFSPMAVAGGVVSSSKDDRAGLGVDREADEADMAAGQFLAT
jgi:hypothetical protein